MSDPISERIVQDVVKTLKGVRRSRNYSVDLEVVRPNRSAGDVPDAHLAVVFVEDDTRLPSEVEWQEAAHWTMTVAVEVHVYESESSSIPIDQRINTARADIEKALMADPFRDGLALDTRIESPTYWEPIEGDMAGVTVRVAIDYRTSITDPYSTP